MQNCLKIMRSNAILKNKFKARMSEKKGALICQEK